MPEVDQEQWQWPCNKRIAHGPHRVEWVSMEEDQPGVTVPYRRHYDCDGVKAHPMTQIGKGSLPLVKPPLDSVLKDKTFDLDFRVPPELREDENSWAWPDEVTQRIPDSVWNINDSKIRPLRVGSWVRIISPMGDECEYRVAKLNDKTGEALLKRAGS